MNAKQWISSVALALLGTVALGSGSALARGGLRVQVKNELRRTNSPIPNPRISIARASDGLHAAGSIRSGGTGTGIPYAQGFSAVKTNGRWQVTLGGLAQ